MNHRQVEAFRAAFQLGSASAAAEALHVTQPAISRLIADLERQVGFSLFERRQRGLHPTQDGQQLYAEVERSFRGMDLIMEAAEAIRSHGVGRVRIIAMPAYADGVLSSAIGAFVARYPGIRVELESGPKKLAVERVVSEQFDVGVGILPLPEQALNIFPLGDNDAICIAPLTHGLAGVDSVDLATLAGQPFIALAQGSPFRATVDRLFQKSGVSPKLVVEARTQRGICNMVAAGAGLSIIDSSVAREFMDKPFAMISLRPKTRWSLAAFTPLRVDASQATKTFLAFLSDYLAQERS
ncbi:LysR substrate-binding domain-containing protein [Rhodovibrionaceae bacterium A322]